MEGVDQASATPLVINIISLPVARKNITPGWTTILLTQADNTAIVAIRLLIALRLKVVFLAAQM
jgi:hypothetical protein